MAKKGLAVGGFVQLDMTKVLHGGVDTNSLPLRYLLDLNVTLDTKPTLGWDGGTVFFDFQSHDGENASQTAVGDIQGFDNLDAGHFVQIYQLWYQQLFADGKFRVKAGKMDANVDFSAIDHAKEFLQATAAYSPTIFPMVTYPDPAPGAEFFFQPADVFYVGVGAYYSNSHQTFLDLAGQPENIERTAGGTFMIAEAGSRWKLAFNGQSLAGHAGFGGWYHTGDFPRVINPSESVHGSGGTYVFFDQSLWTDNNGPDHAPRSGVFMNAGEADARTNPLDEQAGGGFAASGFIPGRSPDVVGVFASWAHLPAQPLIVDRAETAVEIFYRFQPVPWFALKPDIQYIASPGGRFPDVTVFTLRAEVDF